MKLDQKTELHFREVAMRQAQATHEAQATRTADETLRTAEKYFNFLAGNTTSAGAIEIPTPAEIYDNIIAADATVPELQELHRIKLLELEVLSNALCSRGATPA